jgi:outer membrane receptor protein involved in Fe transport
MLLIALPTDNLQAQAALQEIIVTAERRPTELGDLAGNIRALSADEINGERHAHIYELMTRVAGVWIGRGSGQESLPSIRSPVLTGAGSCGGFLVLEDSIPTRPSGFCNVNQLFEVPTELANSIEVIRGPGNALYGSNALHGTINTLMPTAADDSGRLGLELGANDFLRLDALGTLPGTDDLHGGFVVADDGGFRDDSGYRQSKAFLRYDEEIFGMSLRLGASLSDLDQETAGFILGEDAYKDPALNRQNLNPEAFRKADSQRVFAHWQKAGEKRTIDIRPYLRRSDMTFLQHFLPGQPLEENGHVSAGALLSTTYDGDDTSTVVGVDFEWADVFLKQTQFGPTSGSPFLVETRPEGKHYDYDVTSVAIAPYVQATIELSARTSLSLGLRAEYIRYDYTNNMLTGNTRDDGTVCGFGGCLYTRPANRTDDFINAAPKLGVLFGLTETTSLYATLARGFRAPQMTELYRLQSGQEIADIDSETLDSLEAGIRHGGEAWSIDAAAFFMQKKNSVLRDADGFNISSGRSRHEGIEVSTNWQMTEQWALRLNGTFARHTYDFDLIAARGETFVSGNDVDTAPRWSGSAELLYAIGDRADATLQWIGLGDYYLDAENQFSYGGHDLLNARASFELTDHVNLSAKLNNLLDEDYADRADFAFGNYRYFPGRGREFFVRLEYAY